MSTTAEDFLIKADEKAFDLPHRKTINHNIGKYNVAVERGLSKFENLEASKKKAHVIKWRVMENLDKFLPEFEANFLKRGGKVIWANDVEEAQQEILNIIKKRNGKTVIKAKSMTTEEIHLNEFLEKNDIESLESDLGEYIVQLLGQKPYHIVTPAMHLSKEEIAALFHEKFGTPVDATPQQLTQKARELLRQKYLDADIGISGGNFLIADTGSIALTENEGNARLCTTFPKVHIAIVGIEKIIPSIVLDIRYATKKNFMQQVMYKEAKAFARKPVVEKLSLIQAKLNKKGYGLKIFDAYRPYEITLAFWEKASDKSFVANPAKGSKHNRGCAVDLTIIDLKTGKDVPMPTPYDSFEAAAAPHYDKLPANIKKNRDFLIATMQANGFKVIYNEWWHFDFTGWEQFPVMDIPFNQIP